jgi:hypothetical protein
MNRKKLRRLAWAAVMAAGVLDPWDAQDYRAAERGRRLEKRHDQRGRAYRTVRDYVVPRVSATRDSDGRPYIPASLGRIFFDGELAGNYSWPLLRRPEGAPGNAVFNRAETTGRGPCFRSIAPWVTAEAPPVYRAALEEQTLAAFRRGW